LLDECLSHVAKQRFESGDEVIVVDNGSTDETPVVVARYANRLTVPLRHLAERRPGKTHALATAVAAATGDILAFTDDDVNVDDTWLDALRTAMADAATALIGGPVAPRWEHQPPRWLHASCVSYGQLCAPLALLNYGRQPLELGARTVLGANLAVRRDVFPRDVLPRRARSALGSGSPYARPLLPRMVLLVWYYERRTRSGRTALGALPARRTALSVEEGRHSRRGRRRGSTFGQSHRSGRA